jgi:type II secretory pathway pseudopilin PulG
MTILNRAATAAVDVLFYPLAWLSPIVGLAVVALLTAILALWVVKRTSDQRRVRAAKNGMYAALLEMRLFNDDLRAILRAQGDVLKYNARYLRASLIPILWLIVPFGLLVVQLESYYACRGLTPDEPALVTAHLRTGTNSAEPLTLETPSAIRADTPAMWFPATGEVVWRVVPEAAGEYSIRIRVGSAMLAKTLVVSDAVSRRSTVRPAARWLDQIAYPSEPPLPADSRVDAITVGYPPRELTILGWRTPWVVIYGVLTVLFGLGLGRVFRIEI